MRYKNLGYVILLVGMFTGCGSVADRNDELITKNHQDTKVAEYLYINQNHARQHDSDAPNHKTRAFSETQKDTKFESNTYFVTKQEQNLQIKKADTTILISKDNSNQSFNISLENQSSEKIKNIRTDGNMTTETTGDTTTINTHKTVYEVNESIEINIAGMLGDKEDWIGIYRIEETNDWDNVVNWRWTKSIKQGLIYMHVVEAGEYEVRAFFENSFNDVATSKFTVVDKIITEKKKTPPKVEDKPKKPVVPVVVENDDFILYEDAENGISDDWQVVMGTYKPKRISTGYKSKGSVKLTTNWVSKVFNGVEYQLPLNNYSHTTLELDVGGVGKKGGKLGGIHYGSKIGSMPHYSVGVYVTTKFGARVMTWDSWFTHDEIDAFKASYGGKYVWLYYPSPIELVRGYGFQNDLKKWEHFKVNLNDYLEQLEPGNKIISVDTFVATGGFLDNIKLTNNK